MKASRDAQDKPAQINALTAANCERLFSEKTSGKSTGGRPKLDKPMKALLPGDTVVVTKLDRVARWARDLLTSSNELKKRG